MKYRIVKCKFQYRIQKKTFLGWKFLKTNVGTMSDLYITLTFDKLTDAEEHIQNMLDIEYINNEKNWKPI